MNVPHVLKVNYLDRSLKEDNLENTYVCTYYVNALGTLVYNDVSYAYSSPALLITKPGVFYKDLIDGVSRRFVVNFTLDENDLNDFNLLNLNEEDNKNLLELFALLNESTDNAFLDETFMKILTKLHTFKDNTKNPYRDLINKVKNYIKENYSLKIDFNLIAASYGYSYNRFRHIFTNETGMSIKQYVLNCRLDAAKNLLLNTDLNIKEVALETGFMNNVHFTNFFTERMKMSPREFRNQYKREFHKSTN